jgi:hypothetical protein
MLEPDSRGLVPAIHAVLLHVDPSFGRLSIGRQPEEALLRDGVDDRNKSGHDGAMLISSLTALFLTLASARRLRHTDASGG